MPISEPEGPTATEWEVTADSVEHAGGYPLTMHIRFTTDNVSHPAVQGIVQQAVDLIDGSPAFNVMSGVRQVTFAEYMTPTNQAEER